MSDTIVFDIQDRTVAPKGTEYFIDVLIRNDQGELLVDRTKVDCDRALARLCWLRGLARRLKDMKIEVTADVLDLQQLAAVEAYRQEHPEQYKQEPAKEDPLESTPPEIRAEAEALLKSPDLIQRIRDDIAYLGLAGESDTALAVYLIATSRLGEKPLAGVVAGASSTGKSHINNTVARMMPQEAILQAHDLTAECLYYLPSGSLVHKAIFAGERVQFKGEAEAASKALREGLSDGYLKKIVTIKDRATGELVAKRIEQPGPWAYLESTTATSVGDETSTRMLFLYVDESPAQTGRVVNLLSREAAGEFSTSTRTRIIAVHQCLQQLLDGLPVAIPWVSRLHLPEARPATRRAFGHLLGIIRAVALLRQRQHSLRDGRDGVCIVADEADYGIARKLATSIFAKTYDRLPTQSRALLADLQGKFQAQQPFTMADVAAVSTDISEKQLRRRLRPLESQGLIQVDTQHRP